MGRDLSPLPIDEVLPALLAALTRGSAAVLVAPPGAGKTTRVPPALLAALDAETGAGRIVMLEPRRLAARAAARRISDENGWGLGEEVGFQIRFERCAGPRTRILVVTEGILVQMLQADPLLDGIATLVFDELHERSLHTDLSLAMARRVQREVRPDLKIVAMSATLDPGPIAEFLGGCAVIAGAGRLHPVEVLYSERPATAPLPAQVVAGVRRVLDATPGDLLVFLPGVGEIQRCAEALAPIAAREGLTVARLYGDLPSDQQDAVLRRAALRRIVLATNVAETSVTVDGVTGVVDSGWVRRLRYDPASGLDRLELGRISRASADQRAGRAGRQAPGVCLRLWPAYEQPALAARELPEILRVDLAGPALQLHAWGETDLSSFGWLEPPDPPALAAALELLHRLGALDARGVTPLGQTLARLPVHPRLGRLLLEGDRSGWRREAALLAALLSERDPFAARRGPADPGRRSERPDRPERSDRSDLLARLEALEAFSRRGEAGETGNLHPQAARFVLRAAAQLTEALRRDTPAGRARREEKASPGGAVTPAPAREEALGRALLAAYPDRVARRREPKSPRGLMVGGRGVRLAEGTTLLESELFLCVDLDDGPAGTRSEARVRGAIAVDPSWLPTDRVRTVVDLAFDPERERIAAWKRALYEDLVIAEGEVPVPSTPEVGKLLVQAASLQLERALALDDPEVASFRVRVRCLAGWMPELELPRLDDEELRSLLPALAAGCRSFAELRRAPLLAALAGLFSWQQLEAVGREAPERLAVPSGSQIRLLYEEARPPVLAARIQELFGLPATPRVAAGRVPVLLHLLAPNGRPQQVTEDLASFWANTYPQVRKELAGRYPKHSWPLDPWNARAERRPQRQR
jgi:ATP-dependent helicase HrpB